MGPRLFRRGNPRSDDGRPQPLAASMGPRLFRRGNVEKLLIIIGRADASMGPRLFRRGNDRRRPAAGVHRPDASMGPRLFRRGNPDRARYRFVEDALQWGHAFSDVEIRIALGTGSWKMRFNGATPFQTWKLDIRLNSLRLGYALQWGHAFSDVEISGRPSSSGYRAGFNGATPFQTWKCSWGMQNGTQPDSASMGPRLFRRGNMVREEGEPLWPEFASMGPRLFRRGNTSGAIKPSARCSSFNGATPFQTWKFQDSGMGQLHD